MLKEMKQNDLIHIRDLGNGNSLFAGVALHEFSCASAESKMTLAPEKNAALLLCFDGTMTVELCSARKLRVGKRIIWISSDTSCVKSISFSEHGFRGVLLEACPEVMCAMIKTVLDSAGAFPLESTDFLVQIDRCGGCAALGRTAWSEAFFNAYDIIPEKNRSAYFILKTAELACLICSGHLMIYPPMEARYHDGYQRDIVRQVHEFILGHIGEKLTIAALSERFGLSATMLKECFKNVYGKPIHRYLKDLRMAEAERLLMETDDMVADIAAAAGYGSSTQFGAAFKQIHGSTPVEYRRQMRRETTG